MKLEAYSRQPVIVQLKKDRPQSLRVVGEMTDTNEITHPAILLGTYPGFPPPCSPTKSQLSGISLN
jgi:hypothetical protein